MTPLQKIARSRLFSFYALLLAALVLVPVGVRLGQDYLERRVIFEPRPLSSAEHQGLMDRMEQFKRAYEAGDAAAIAGMLPPGYLERGGARVEQRPEWVRARFRASAEALFNDVRIDRVDFDPVIGRSGAGRGDLILAQVEIATRLDAGNGIRLMQYPVMAIRDDAEWWLLQVTSRPMREVLLEAYPDIQGLNERPLYTLHQ